MHNAIGLDFGTSNTVLTACDADGEADVIHFGGEQDVTSLASVLSFLDPEVTGDYSAHPEIGPWAIQQFIDNVGECRFIQSLKTFVASKLFRGTGIYGRMYSFEDLLQVFLQSAGKHHGVALDDEAPRLIVGRPVTFAGGAPDEQLAMKRYRASLSRFGFSEVHFVYEPVAAAFAFAQRLEGEATVLVADFGGGTTDFSLMRFAKKDGKLSAEPLGRGGLGIAGNTLDYRIVDQVISPELGKGTLYRSMGKELELPPNIFANFAHWHMLSVFKASNDYRELKKMLRYCVEPEKLERLIDLVDSDQGYPLYKAVSEAKAALSSHDSTEIRFEPLGRDFSATVTRQDFESWIANDLERISACVGETLAKSGLTESSIDKVFLTGGTSYVPAIRKLFEDRFGKERMMGGDEMSSVAKGLALIGQRDDISNWTAEEAA